MDVYACRDLDSRFSAREVSAVKEWLASGQPIHAMRDHPAHTTPLLGAAWDARIDQDNIRLVLSFEQRKSRLKSDMTFFFSKKFLNFATSPS